MIPLACDRCGANPYPHGYRAINKDGRVLDLCLHHFNEHATALTRATTTIRNGETPNDAKARLDDFVGLHIWERIEEVKS